MRLANFALAAVLAGVSLPSSANDWWVTLASTEKHTHRAKLGTFEITTNKAGEDVVSVVGQHEDKRGGKIQVQQWYVSIADCERGFGDLVILKANGTFITSVDFVLGGDSVASGKADGICYFLKMVKDRINEKSIESGT